MIRKSILILIFFECLLLNGQNLSFFNNRLIEGRMHYGFLWPHHSSIEYSVNGHVPGFELNMLYQGNNRNIWEDLYRNPRKGFGMSYYYMQDHDVFGSSIGLYGLYDFPIIRYKTFASSYRICGGLSYLTEIWDIDDNYLETAIGTHINLYFRFAFTSRLALGKNKEITFDAGLTHFSNGNIHEPNLGLNIVSVAAGFIYHFNTPGTANITPVEKPALKKINFHFQHAAGYKAIGGFDNNYYYKSVVNMHAGYNINLKRQLGLGIDVFYDGSQVQEKKKDGYTEITNKDLFQAGALIFQDLRYNRLILTIQIGIYIYNGFNDKIMYNRNGLKYKINEHFCATVCLKSHKFQADYIEWGIGFTL